MKNLFFCSFMFAAKESFREYISRFEAKDILFIPTASHVEPRRDYVYRAWSYFESLGYKVKDLEVSEISSEEAKRQIEDAEILYVAGGNTFYLLQELQKKDLLDIIRKKVEKGMVYVGESAGSILASSDIDYVHKIDPKDQAPELLDTKGLGLMDFYVIPHYLDRPFEEVTQATYEMYKDELELVLIDNKQSIIADGSGKFEIKTDK